jgi:hypothetical protein
MLIAPNKESPILTALILLTKLSIRQLKEIGPVSGLSPCRRYRSLYADVMAPKLMPVVQVWDPVVPPPRILPNLYRTARSILGKI